MDTIGHDGGRRAIRAGACLLLGLAALVGCGSDDTSTPPPSTHPPAEESDLEVALAGTVVAELDEPIDLAARPSDDGHVWVAERDGRVLRMEVGDDALVAVGGPLLDLTGETRTDAEQGLLAIGFSPSGEELYVSFTDLEGTSRVDAFPIVDDAIDEAGRRSVFELPQPDPNHNGGDLWVLDDGTIWMGLGDGGGADDPDNRAQDPDGPYGSMISIDPLTGEWEVMAKGLRNPWRFAIDGDMVWIADVGQDAREEINHLPVDEVDGANFGWSGWEGSQPHLRDDDRVADDPVMPVHEYVHEGPFCSVIGGTVYRGSAVPPLGGAYLFTDWCNKGIRALIPPADAGGAYGVLDLGVDVEWPIGFGSDHDGEVYVLSGEGAVTRLDPL